MKKRDYIYIVTTYCALTISILLGLGFIFQAIRIYDKDNLPMYSKDIVSTYLLQLLPLIIIFILIVIFLGVYVVIKNISNKQFVKIFNKERYQTIIKNYDFKQLLENKDFKKEHILRLIIKIINYVICGSCLLICLIYMFTNNHLNSMEAPTPQIIDLFVHFLPWIGISLISGLICIYVNDYSYLRSINNIKKLEIEKQNKKYVPCKYEKYILIGTQIFFVCLSITLIIVGIFNKEVQDVYNKAANICTECIGLG